MLGIRPEEDKELRKVLTNLCTESKSKVVFLIDKAGQLLSRSDAPAYTSDDITFASLTAGNVAASEALSKLLGDKTLSHAFTETQDEGIYMSLIVDNLILVVIFEKYVSNLGIIRVKLRKYKVIIKKIIDRIHKTSEMHNEIKSDINIEDLDIDDLFS